MEKRTIKINAQHVAQIKAVLGDLHKKSTEIQSSAVMTRDGATIASLLGNNADTNRLGAMCAALLSLGDKTANELERGALKQVLLHGDNGYLLIIHVGSNAVLAVVSNQSSNLGMIFVEARNTAQKIASELGF